MIRIGLLLDVPAHGGGTFQYSQSMLHALMSLPSTEFEVVVAFTRDDWEVPLQQLPLPAHRIRTSPWHRLLQRAWNSLSLPAGPWRRVLHRLHPVPRKLVELDCDAWIFPSQDLWGIWSPVNAINTIHDLMHRYESRFPEVGRLDIRWRRDRLHRRICRYSRGILVDSPLGRQHVLESYAPPAERVHVLPYVAPPAITTARPDKDDVRARYRLPAKYFFYPAQFWQHKNHANLLRAIAKLRPAVPDIALVLVGARKNAATEVHGLIESLGLEDCVQWHGYVPDQDMPGLYRNARALVMPSYFGPTNIPALEAMSLGCAMAVSGIYAVPEQLGDAAIYFDPSSVASIAQALLALWNDDELIATLKTKQLQCLGSHSMENFSARLETILRDSTASARPD